MKVMKNMLKMKITKKLANRLVNRKSKVSKKSKKTV